MRRTQQEALWERHPDKMAQLQRVQQRKEVVNAAVVLPLLGGGKQPQRLKPCDNGKQTRDGEAPRKSLNQVSSLPALHKY